MNGPLSQHHVIQGQQRSHTIPRFPGRAVPEDPRLVPSLGRVHEVRVAFVEQKPSASWREQIASTLQI